MSESNGEPDTGITDEQLPDDLTPSEDNPLAEGLDDGETAGDLLEDGKGDEGDEADDAEEGSKSDEGDQPDSDESGA